MPEDGHGRNTVVLTPRSLIPIGAAITALILLLPVAWQAGGAWRAQNDAVSNLETRVWIVEEKLETWRREVESRLGKLPDVEPQKDETRRTGNGPRSLQNHQVWSAGRESWPDIGGPGSGGAGNRRRGRLHGQDGGADDRRPGAGSRADSGGDAVLSPPAAALLAGAPLIRPGW